jgi:hypothetical protein
MDKFLETSIKNVQDVIDAKLITFSDIENYIESLNMRIVNEEYIEGLEEMSRNYPG